MCKGSHVFRGQGLFVHITSQSKLHIAFQDLLAAINHTKHGITVASAHRKHPSSFAGRLAGYIVSSLGTSGTEWIAGMTPVERHAELVYAESLYQKVRRPFERVTYPF